MRPKPLLKSNTIQFGAALTIGGVFVILEQIIAAIDITQLPPEVAAWVGPIGSVVGLIVMLLRVKTAVPLKGTKAGDFAAWIAEQHPTAKAE